MTHPAFSMLDKLMLKLAGRVLACPHTEGAGVGLMCGPHPAAGIMCPACATEHGRRHLEACASCGQSVTTARIELNWPDCPLTCTTTSGRQHRAPAVVIVSAGLCPPCLDEVRRHAR